VATTREFIDYVVDQVGIGERLTFRKMFGEYALYVDDKVVGTAELMAPPKPKKKAGTSKKVG